MKIKKWTVIICSALLLMACMSLFVYYAPFIRERMAFSLTHEEGVTHVINTSIGVSFDLQGDCSLVGDVVNHLASSSPYFSGYFACGDYSQAVSVGGNTGKNPEEENILIKNDRLKMAELFSGSFRYINIFDSTNEKYLNLSATKNENNMRGFEILDAIKNSINFIK